MSSYALRRKDRGVSERRQAAFVFSNCLTAHNNTMTQDLKPRKLHARVLARRNAPHQDFLLSDRDFRFAADCERMRVDRNGSVLSLLLVRLPQKKSSPADIAFLARVLEGRLRTTDTPGLLDDGRIAVLLPDTPAEGAWKVATDVSEVYPPGPERPECDVLVYPPHSRLRETHTREPVIREPALDEVQDAAPVAAPPEVAEVADAAEAEPSEFFFVKRMPRWKRALDLAGASVGLVVTAPIVLTAAAAIKITSPGGPAFFVQEREGRGGRRFNIWKLRTMCADAEAQKSELRPLSQQDGPAFKMERDPRTTRLGRFLRWSSIDEMPQFWNVLKGEMSLVGPRPLPTDESQACELWQRRRLDVTPGITCTWQVSGRGKVRFDDWVRMDLRYAAEHSVFKDLKLVFVTLPALLFQRGMR
jgi:lipopolysaccharide/colanic/teichoic acid biosynthesis glycosyltransferase